MHDHLQNQLSKAKDPLNASSAEKFSMAQIMAAKDHIDRAMNVATDNRFQTALDQYATDSKAINVGVLLNDYRPHLTNMTGELQAQRYHNWVASLAKERGDPGIDPSMDIPDKAMQSLISIDTDLKRAKLIKLGAPAGSQTNLLGALAEKAGLKAAHALVGKIPILGPVLNVGTDYMAQRKLVADTAKHLAEPEGGYTYPDPDEQTAGGPATFNRPVPAASGTSSPDTPPQPAPAPSAAPTANAPARGATGAGPGESIAFTPSNAAVPVRYTVRDASDLIASQLADGRLMYPLILLAGGRWNNRIASRFGIPEKTRVGTDDAITLQSCRAPFPAAQLDESAPQPSNKPRGAGHDPPCRRHQPVLVRRGAPRARQRVRTRSACQTRRKPVQRHPRCPAQCISRRLRDRTWPRGGARPDDQARDQTD
jgi:ribosomal protein L18